MKILLTGATGYIGKRILPVLLNEGHELYCCVRDRNRFWMELPHEGVRLIEVDFLEAPQRGVIPSDIDAAYYLIHSMASSIDDFEKLEEKAARHFNTHIEGTGIRQVIYLSGIVNEDKLSRHLASRKRVEEVLTDGPAPLTVLRAGIIVGSGSASFEIIRDLVEKLPVMITPRWLNTKCQPISVRDVLAYLSGVLGRADTHGQSFDIGGPDVLTYRRMLLQYAEVRGLRRWIWTIPVMTPRLSSYWLYFVTATSYKLAVNLVNSMKVDVVCSDRRLEEILQVRPATYKQSVRMAFDRIEQNAVASSWKDSLTSSDFSGTLEQYLQVPVHGCYIDRKVRPLLNPDVARQRIWSIGGQNGWYYGNWLWRIRGWLDKLVGGIGLRRGRTSPTDIHSGDALDFWRVLIANRRQGRLLLYAEMKLPGEAWLEFRIRENEEGPTLHQTATFRPRGILGRLYWFLSLPFHLFIFSGMIDRITSPDGKQQIRPE